MICRSCEIEEDEYPAILMIDWDVFCDICRYLSLSDVLSVGKVCSTLRYWTFGLLHFRLFRRLDDDGDGIKNQSRPLSRILSRGILLTVGASLRSLKGNSRQFRPWFFLDEAVISNFPEARCPVCGNPAREHFNQKPDHKWCRFLDFPE